MLGDGTVDVYEIVVPANLIIRVQADSADEAIFLAYHAGRLDIGKFKDVTQNVLRHNGDGDISAHVQTLPLSRSSLTPRQLTLEEWGS